MQPITLSTSTAGRRHTACMTDFLENHRYSFQQHWTFGVLAPPYTLWTFIFLCISRSELQAGTKASLGPIMKDKQNVEIDWDIRLRYTCFRGSYLTVQRSHTDLGTGQCTFEHTLNTDSTQCVIGGWFNQNIMFNATLVFCVDWGLD